MVVVPGHDLQEALDELPWGCTPRQQLGIALLLCQRYRQDLPHQGHEDLRVVRVAFLTPAVTNVAVLSQLRRLE